MLDLIKAKIVESQKYKFVSLNRKRIDDTLVQYQISVEDFCKLIDATTKGKVLDYICYHICNRHVYIYDAKQTIINFIDCIFKNLTLEQRQKIFGKDAPVNTELNFKRMLSRSSWYTEPNVVSKLKEYIYANFKIDEGNNIERKVTSRYINV